MIRIMTFRTLFHIVLILLALVPLAARAEQESSGEAAAASRFVALLDASDTSAAWQELTPLAQTIKSSKQWQRLQQSLRTAYGPLEKRVLHGISIRNRYPMLPDGRYAIVQFDSVFRNKRTAIETIVLVQVRDGHWLVHDYINN